MQLFAAVELMSKATKMSRSVEAKILVCGVCVGGRTML
jgi:hypothetical protein